MTDQEHATVMEAVADAVLAVLPASMPAWERTNYANLIRREVARRLAKTKETNAA